MDKKNNDESCVLTSLFDAIDECFLSFAEEQIAFLEDALVRLFLNSLRESLEGLEKDGLIDLSR